MASRGLRETAVRLYAQLSKEGVGTDGQIVFFLSQKVIRYPVVNGSRSFDGGQMIGSFELMNIMEGNVFIVSLSDGVSFHDEP